MQRPIIDLSRNENSESIPSSSLAELCRRVPSLQRYPFRENELAIAAAARCFDISPDRIIFTRGIDDAVDQLIRRYHRRRFFVARPGFDGFVQRLRAHELAYEELFLGEDFRLPQRLPAELDEHAFVFLADPNNPTGQTVGSDGLMALIERGCGCLIDEAYKAFCSRERDCSLLGRHIYRFRSFSKEFSLAGMRLGALLGETADIEDLRDRQVCCPLDAISCEAIRYVADHRDVFAKNVETISRRRDGLCELLTDFGYEVRNCEANFFLLRAVDPSAMTKSLSERGILVRDPGDMGLTDYVRITVGTPEENALLIRELRMHQAAVGKDFASQPVAPDSDSAASRFAPEWSDAEQICGVAWQGYTDLPTNAVLHSDNVVCGQEGQSSNEDGFQRNLERVLAYTRGLAVSLVLQSLIADGVLSAMRRDFSVGGICESKGYRPSVFSAIVRFLITEQIIEEDAKGGHRLSRFGLWIEEHPGWLNLLVGGYRDVLGGVNTILKEGPGAVPSDLKFVGLGSNQISQFDAFPLVRKLINDVNSDPRCVMDLGCGSGFFLVELCRCLPRMIGIGVEQSEESVQDARRLVRRSGLDERITMVQGDVLGQTIDETVDLLLFAFVLQELVSQVGEERFVDWLRRIRASGFSGHILIVEVEGGPIDEATLLSPFGLGYYNPYFLIHGLTRQQLLPTKRWVELFEQAGYRCSAQRVVDPGVDPTGLEVGLAFQHINSAQATRTANFLWS